jgi:hypothetical protein
MVDALQLAILATIGSAKEQSQLAESRNLDRGYIQIELACTLLGSRMVCAPWILDRVARGEGAVTGVHILHLCLYGALKEMVS